ncbi:MAG TPA: hypothetical protein VMU45_14095 [Candidatus Eisenbacteria bacterium]|nr:hypothetical protein [Candidatus Eisenbacteria bacterium]
MSGVPSLEINPPLKLAALAWRGTRRPHEALGMERPASHWQPSPRRYDPQPPRWQYPPGAIVGKVDTCGRPTLAGLKWRISSALAGEWEQVVKLGERIQVYYCTTLVRELDPAIQRSTMVERWMPLPHQEL